LVGRRREGKGRWLWREGCGQLGRENQAAVMGPELGAWLSLVGGGEVEESRL
jgi:hypothetical protein